MGMPIGATNLGERPDRFEKVRRFQLVIVGYRSVFGDSVADLFSTDGGIGAWVNLVRN